ncbi:MAG: rubredoxin, partial [Desulfobulbaceae bacterium]|nr:rubredoxin [Desulfobulbaceae bacterium]
MAKYRCQVCEFIVDEEKTDSLWVDLPDSWKCPVCGSLK